MLNSVKIIKTLIDNIANDPNNVKYHKVRFDNPKIKEAIADIDSARFLLEIIGFGQVLQPSKDTEN